MYKLIYFATLFSTLSWRQALGRVSPSYIHPCPELTSECLIKRVQETLPQFSKGIPELGVLPIDPITNNHTEFLLPGGLKIELNNSTLSGMSNCIIDSLKVDNYHVRMSVHCDVSIKGYYKAHGRIMMFPINGDGDVKIKIVNLSCAAKIEFEDIERDGISYRVIKNFSFKHKFNGRINYELTNLFKGNAELSNSILSFMNENWKTIAEEFGDPFIKRAADRVSDSVKKFFVMVPKDELFVV